MRALALVTAPTPDALAAAIRAEVEAAERDWRSALAHAIRAGQLLLEAKARCRHGEWLPWLAANVDVSDRSAQGYMRLARNPQALADLAPGTGLEAALRQLAKPRQRAVEQPERRPPWWPLQLPDVLPAADPSVEAALRRRVEAAVTELEDAQRAYTDYAVAHKAGAPLASASDQAGWERQAASALYGGSVR